MKHADPWDEITRLEKQMEAESLELQDRSRDEAREREAIRSRRGPVRRTAGPVSNETASKG